MITRTIYVDTVTLNFIYSILEGTLSLTRTSDVIKRVSFNRLGDYQHEIQVPLISVSKDSQNDKSSLSLFELQMKAFR